MGRRRVLHALAGAVCLLALVSALAIRTGESAHHPAHRAAVVMAASDSSVHLRGVQPLAIVDPATVAVTQVVTTTEPVGHSTSYSAPVSSTRMRGPPGTA